MSIFLAANACTWRDQFSIFLTTKAIPTHDFFFFFFSLFFFFFFHFFHLHGDFLLKKVTIMHEPAVEVQGVLIIVFLAAMSALEGARHPDADVIDCAITRSCCVNSVTHNCYPAGQSAKATTDTEELT
jgi:hypothetical protein